MKNYSLTVMSHVFHWGAVTLKTDLFTYLHMPKSDTV